MSRERRHTTVSTHAPLAGSDDALPRHFLLDDGFNPRSPCGERPAKRRIADEFAMFQPTLPLRGATRLRQLPACGDVVSTHAPLAGSDGAVGAHSVVYQRVSTHAPLAGSDSSSPTSPPSGTGFNPRSPCGERLRARGRAARADRVSTHAPLAGSD